MAAVSMYDQRAAAPVFETLLAFNEEDQSLISNIITSYGFSADNSYVDLNIRNGIYFHKDSCFENKSRRLTSRDVKFTLDFACSSNALNKQGQLLTPKIIGALDFLSSKDKNFKKGVEGIQVLSDTTLRIQLVDSTQTILKILTHQSLSVISKQAYDFYSDQIINHPIGTGPFVFDQINKNGIRYTRNPNYWKIDKYGNRLPFIDSLNLKFKTNDQEVFNMFTSQRTDLLSNIPINEINSLFGSLMDAQEGKNILHKVEHKKGLKVNLLEFDCSRPPFDDIYLRKAIYHAVDRDKICRDYLFGEGSPANKGVLPSVPFFKYIGSSKAPYNLKIAKSYLRKSEYKKGDTLTLFLSERMGSQEDAWCQSLVQELRENLKLEFRLVRLPFKAKQDAINSGRALVWKSAFISDYPDAESFLMPYYSNPKIKMGKNVHYASREFDIKMDKARAEIRPAVRNEHFNACVQILNEEAPIVPLYFEDLVVVFNLRLRGAQVNSFGIIDLSAAYLKPIE
jgi:peptide/nickel transport system substrate-binding protein